MVAGDKLVRPLNAPPGYPPAYGTQPGAQSPVVLARLVIVSGAGIDGVYVYAAGTTPKLGNPPITWESSSLVDPYGNILPSTTGVAGTGTFQAGNSITTIAGTFTYNGAAALGNLLSSDAQLGGTDAKGNRYLPGVVSYVAAAGGYQASQIFGGAVAFQSNTTYGGAYTYFGSIDNGIFDSESSVQFNLLGSVAFVFIGPAAVNNDYWYPPSGDATGAADYAAISFALSAGYAVHLTQGTYYLSQPLTWANGQLSGVGDDTSVQPGSAWAGAALMQLGSNTSVVNLAGNGGTSTRRSNPAADFIQTQAGATFWRVEDVRCDFMNGHVIFCAPATGSHGTIRCIKGEHNGGGIAIDNGTAANITAEVNILDIDLQNCETSPVIYMSDVTDVLVGGPVNGSILAGANVKGINVVGTCQTCFLFGLDVGGGAGAGMLVFDSNATGSPTEIEVGPGTLQQGQIGILINAGSRLAFHDVWAKSNQGDGWQITGTAGAGIVLTGCGGNGNNAGAGGAYDMDVTVTTAHVLNQGFRYISTGVTAGRFLVAANHYTEGFPQASLTTAGAAAGGW